jgi:hypothetical protein
MNPLLLLHLMAVGIWIGCIAGETRAAAYKTFFKIAVRSFE